MKSLPVNRKAAALRPALRSAGQQAAASQRRGLSLIEVVLALGILALGLSSLLALFSFGAGMASNANLQAEAASSLDFIVADLEERLFLQDADGEWIEPRAIEDAPVPGNERLAYSAKATRDPRGDLGNGRPVLYRVDIDIAWRSQGIDRSVAARVLLPQSIPFGERLRRRFVPGAAPEPPTTEPPANEPDEDSSGR